MVQPAVSHGEACAIESLIELAGQVRAEMLLQFADDVNIGSNRRRFLVERNGLALLLAYCLDGAANAGPDRAAEWPPSSEVLQLMLRDHALIVQPGELLVVMVPPSWLPQDCKDVAGDRGCRGQPADAPPDCGARPRQLLLRVAADRSMPDASS